MPDLVSRAPEVQSQTPPVQEISSVEADEQALEQLESQAEDFLEEEPEAAPTTKVIEGVPVQSAPTPPALPKDEAMVEVEKILEEGMGKFFEELPIEARPKFKLKGEEAATEISGMVRSLKVQVKRVLQLIRDWLLLIPKANKFFLEQEAKIKTDKIVELIEARKTDRANRP